MFSTRIEHYDQARSTMKILQKRAEKGEGEGLVIWADEIKEAVGRHQRQWHAGPGGLWISILLRPPLPPTKVGVFNYLASLTVRKALEKLTALPLAIKWPNDIIWKEGNQKVGGILSWGKMATEAVNYLLWGIGLNIHNVLPETMDYRGEIKATSKIATSLAQLGIDLEVEEFLTAFLDEIEAEYNQLIDNHWHLAAITTQFEKHCATLGKEVRIHTDRDESFQGQAVGIDPQRGSLVVETKEGLKKIEAGDCWHLTAE